jgi:hypothetical protein
MGFGEWFRRRRRRQQGRHTLGNIEGSCAVLCFSVPSRRSAHGPRSSTLQRRPAACVDLATTKERASVAPLIEPCCARAGRDDRPVKARCDSVAATTRGSRLDQALICVPPARSLSGRRPHSSEQSPEPFCAARLRRMAKIAASVRFVRFSFASTMRTIALTAFSGRSINVAMAWLV